MIYENVNVNMVHNFQPNIESGYFQIRDGGKATAFNSDPHNPHNDYNDQLKPTKREKLEKEYLDRSHPGATGNEKALLDALWDQLGGKPKEDFSSMFYSSQIDEKVAELNALLFTQIANHHGNHG